MMAKKVIVFLLKSYKFYCRQIKHKSSNMFSFFSHYHKIFISFHIILGYIGKLTADINDNK